MSTEQYYNYYKMAGGPAKHLADLYAGIELKRDETLKQMLSDFSCIAWTVRSGWGMPGAIDELVFDAVGAFDKKDFKIREAIHGGKKVFCVRGKRNSKRGNELNHRIAEYNSILKDYPGEPDFIFDQLNVRATGLGGASPSGLGIAMLSTYGGRVGDEIFIAIPKKPDRAVDLPDGLTPITYGQFYDAINPA